MAFDETPPIMGPWWVGNTFAGNLGLQVPEEVPLTVPPDGQAPQQGAKTGRQVMFSPAAFEGSINAAFNGPVSSIGDTNNSTEIGMLKRVAAKIASTYQNYRKMRADGIVAIGREIADGLVCTNQWTYEGADEEEGGGDYSPDEIQEMVAAVKCMWEGRGTSGKSHEGFTLREYFLSESCRAKDHGNHTLEVAWDTDDEDEITIGEFLPLLPEHTRPLVYAGTRRFAGVRNLGLNSGPIDLDPQYCVRFIYDSEGGDLGGRSRFENCKDWIQFKWELREKMRLDMNISIGNTPITRYPVVKNNAVETAANQVKAGIINMGLRQGLGVTVPSWDINDALAIMRAVPGIDLSKLDPWAIRNLETGDNSFAGFKTATDLVDEQILFGLLVLPRTVREADHGSKADSEQHTETQVAIDWRWLTYVAGLANNITDALLIQRWGAGARGKVQVKAAPITDEAKAVLQQIYVTLLSDKDLAVKILNIKQDLLKLQIKPKPDFDQDALAKQMAANGAAGDALSSRAKLQNAGYEDGEIDKIQSDKAGEDVIPADADGLGGRARAMSEDDYPHKYSSTQIQLDEAIADEVRNFGASIPDEELAEDGREKDIHVTVKYGLHSNVAAPVRLMLDMVKNPIVYSVGATSLFPASEAAPYDVLKMDVHSNDLHAANRLLSHLPNGDNRPFYRPHVTIAYLKPGMGAKYVGRKVIDDQNRTADTVIFSGRDAIRTPIKFA